MVMGKVLLVCLDGELVDVDVWVVGRWVCEAGVVGVLGEAFVWVV